MILICKGHSFHYEMENICRVFFPYEAIKEQDDDSDIRVETVCEENDIEAVLNVSVTAFGSTAELTDRVAKTEYEYSRECERRLAILIFNILSEKCGFTPKWGILTGVRPIKLIRKLTDQLGKTEAEKYFAEKLLVSAEKIKLSSQTAVLEDSIVKMSRPDSFSLYISIPFCPTRCSYCSFVSQSIEKAMKLVPTYVDYLKKEIAITGEIAKNLGLRLETVYFGGGTPTTLSAEQLGELMAAVESSFDLSTVREYTVEAGRPDTVTVDKLRMLKQYGVSRISINPQTMNDEVLQRIGRNHSAKQVLEAFEMARSVGLNNINMDTIAGLPLDTEESFARTFETLLGLSPENITVHTLAMKKASYLNHDKELSLSKETAMVDNMVSYSQRVLSGAGYRPYYLYRQSKMLGNLENTGWAKPGFEGLYNVYIMEETHSILACGAGATLKLRNPYGDEIERIFNYKFPYEYIERFDLLCERKKQIFEFYDKFLHKKSGT